MGVIKSKRRLSVVVGVVIKSKRRLSVAVGVVIKTKRRLSVVVGDGALVKSKIVNNCARGLVTVLR